MSEFISLHSAIENWSNNDDGEKRDVSQIGKGSFFGGKTVNHSIQI